MRFAVLDSWRGIAALLVALLHLRFLGNYYSLGFVRNSWLFVDFFFVLSGFVITHAYADRLRQRSEILPFAIRRFGRLWPLHAATLAAFLLFEIVKWGLMRYGGLTDGVPAFDPGENYSIPSLATNIVLVHSLGIHDKLTWNTPSWSISTEFYTYLLFAALCSLRRSVLNVVLAAGAVACFWIIADRVGNLNTTYQFGFFRAVLGFFLGSLTYQAYRFVGPEWAPRSMRTAIEVAAVLAVVIFVSSAAGPVSMAADFVFAATVFVFACEGGRVSTMLQRKPFQKLGEWSYSIYMVHALLLMIASRGLLVVERVLNTSLRIPHREPADPLPVELFYFWNKAAMDGVAVLYLVAVVLTAAAASRLVEMPGRRYFNGLAKRVASRAPAADARQPGLGASTLD